MSRKIPSYLKLHVEDEPQVAAPVCDPEVPQLTSLESSFEEATGWRLDLTQDSADSSGRKQKYPPVSDVVLSQNRDEAVSRDVAHRLAESVGGLVDQLQQALNTVWQREAELATGIPVCERSDEDEHLANRLEAVLQAGASSVRCSAAALYLLDDATSELKLRACYGLPTTRLMEPPRPLRGAVADLEALIGHAVVLEDVRLVPHWKTPEPFAAAVCVPVASPSTPLGTAWFFATEPREFSDEETQLLEVIAGRLAADLEREVLLAEGTQSAQMQRELQQAALWQIDRLPNVPPLLEELSVAGWAEQSARLGGAFYDWLILEDGRLSVSLGQAQGTMLESALNATALHSSLKAMSTRDHELETVFERLNDAFWTSSSGDQYASLFSGRIDPESGQLEAAIAGHSVAAIVRPRSVKQLTIAQALLGQQPDHRYRPRKFKLQAGDVLVLANESIVDAVDDDGCSLWDRITQMVMKRRQATAEELVDQSRLILDTFGPQKKDVAIAVVKHNG